MKRIFVFLMLFIGTAAIAHTINWYVDGNIFHTTTCESGEDITPPTAPEKYGYTFKEWGTFTPIEYLKSTGTQWIDTGFYPNGDSAIEIKFICSRGGVAYVKDRKSGTAWGCWNISIGETVIYHPSFGYTSYNANTKNPNILFLGPLRSMFNQISAEYLYTKFQISENPIGLFTAFDGENWHLDYCSGQIYYAKFYNGSTLIRDFIPVLDKNGTPCMFDKVEHKFYYNAGTGDFIAGPIIGE